MHIYVGELMHLLNNVTVDDEGKAVIDGLRLNLNSMDLGPNRTNPLVSEQNYDCVIILTVNLLQQ